MKTHTYLCYARYKLKKHTLTKTANKQQNKLSHTPEIKKKQTNKRTICMAYLSKRRRKK